MAAKLKVYAEDEAKARLAAELPHWYLEDGWIRRRYRTNSWKGTLMVINAVGHLAEAAWHHPDLTASYAWVEVRLMSHDHKGITDKDFALAKKIEEVVQWQPGREGGALEARPPRICASPTSSTTTRPRREAATDCRGPGPPLGSRDGTRGGAVDEQPATVIQEVVCPFCSMGC